MFDEVVALPPRRIPDFGANAVLTSDDIETMRVCQAVKPVGDLKRSVGGILDRVGPRTGPKEGTCSPRGDVALDWEFDWPAMLVKIGKLLSVIYQQTDFHMV